MKLLQDLPSVSLSDRAYLPPAAGVYIAATPEQLLYVGQSGNLRERWVQHDKLDRLIVFPGLRLYYLLAPEGFCGQLESALIRQFAPLLNGNNGELPFGDYVRNGRRLGNRKPKLTLTVSENAKAGLQRIVFELGLRSISDLVETIGVGELLPSVCDCPCSDYRKVKLTLTVSENAKAGLQRIVFELGLRSISDLVEKVGTAELLLVC